MASNPSSVLNSNLFLANADAYRSPEKGRKEPCNLHLKEGKFLDSKIELKTYL
jgi:hypothetical protein